LSSKRVFGVLSTLIIESIIDAVSTPLAKPENVTVPPEDVDDVDDVDDTEDMIFTSREYVSPSFGFRMKRFLSVHRPWLRGILLGECHERSGCVGPK
jgi:hypothetical protein